MRHLSLEMEKLEQRIAPGGWCTGPTSGSGGSKGSKDHGSNGHGSKEGSKGNGSKEGSKGNGSNGPGPTSGEDATGSVCRGQTSRRPPVLPIRRGRRFHFAEPRRRHAARRGSSPDRVTVRRRARRRRARAVRAEVVQRRPPGNERIHPANPLSA